MQGIGPGSVLGGRYTADRRTAQHAGAERWTGRDTTLDRPVVLFTVPRSHPNVDAVLDAARRSAGLENSRLSRILDVGTDDDLAYVVEEALEGSHSLAGLLAAGPLPAPEVRRIAGETALVLDLARHRGLHHQRLTPDLVMRTPDGDVKVRGLATMAALAGIDDVDDQTAARADAVAVVAVAYAGFTGHWPLPGDRGGLPAAPRVSSHVAAPSEIAVGVPADLDALCRLTFANDQGPVTPGDFARQIAPWSPIPVLLPTLDAPEPSAMSVDTGSDQGSADRAEVVRGDEPDWDADDEDIVDDDAQDEGAGDAPETSEGDDEPRGAGPGDRPDSDRPGAGAAAAGAAALAGAGAAVASKGPGMRGDDRGPHTPERGRPGGAHGQGAGGHGVGGRGGVGGPGGQPGPDGAGGPGVKQGAGGPGRRAPGSDPAGRPAAATKAGVPVARRVPAPGGPAKAGLTGGATAAAAKAAGQSGAPKSGSPAAPVGPSPVAAMTAATTAALSSAGAATVSAARALSDRLSDWSTTTRDRARDTVDDVRARREQAAAARAEGRPAGSDTAVASGARASGSTQVQAPGRQGTAGAAAGAGAGAIGRRDSGTIEPPIPLLPPSAAEPLTRDQSRMAIGIIVGFLVLALVFAMWGLSRIPSLPTFGGSDEAGPAPTGTPTPGATEGGDAEGEEGGTDGGESGAAPPAGPLTIAAVTDYDPLGDGAERPEELERILDGDDSTAWASEGYRSSEFSGLKAGLGVILDLGEAASVREVSLVLPSESTGTIHVTDDGAFVEGAELGDLAAAGSFDGEGTVTVTLEQAVTGRYVIVWFTEISTGGEEWYRARLAGASVTS